MGRRFDPDRAHLQRRICKSRLKLICGHTLLGRGFWFLTTETANFTLNLSCRLYTESTNIFGAVWLLGTTDKYYGCRQSDQHFKILEHAFSLMPRI